MNKEPRTDLLAIMQKPIPIHIPVDFIVWFFLLAFLFCAGTFVECTLGQPKTITIQLNQADECLRKGKVKLAEESLLRVIKYSKSREEGYHLAIAKCEVVRGPVSVRLMGKMFNQFITDLNNGVVDRKYSDEEMSRILASYGSLCFGSLGQRDEGIQAYEKALKLAPSDAGLANDIGYTYADSRIRLDEALALTKKAAQMQPSNPAFIDSLGWAYYQSHKYPDALHELRRAVKMYPGDGTLRYHLASTYMKLGRKTEARIEFMKYRACNR